MLAAGFVPSNAWCDPRPKGGTLGGADQASVLAGHDSKVATVLPVAFPLSAASGEARRDSPPTIDQASFNERFAGRPNTDTVATNLLDVDRSAVGRDDDHPELPGEAAGSVRARRERAVFSPIAVFTADPTAASANNQPANDPGADADLSLPQPRADLLSGVPEDYARLAVALAAEEQVDPNWVLSIMRAENAAFDPTLVSSAGAVGLMQVMPEMGAAYGADDLTDPEQNIRAGTRFLRVLIDKYRNPVLIASAYNAGEPRVDDHQSVPLIRETADYVTRVVGYFTGTASHSPSQPDGPFPRSARNPTRRTGPADRARSPMLVFSVADPLASAGRPHRSGQATWIGGAVKIVKEEVLQ